MGGFLFWNGEKTDYEGLTNKKSARLRLFHLKAVRFFTTENFQQNILPVSSTHGLVIILLRFSSAVTSAVFPCISLAVFLFSSSCRCSWGSISALLVSYQSPQPQLNCKESNTDNDCTQDQFQSQHLRSAFCRFRLQCKRNWTHRLTDRRDRPSFFIFICSSSSSSSKTLFKHGKSSVN